MDKEDLESNHVEVTSDERLGVLANQEDRETGRIASVLKYPWACAWCVYATWCIVLVSFDIQAGGSVLGIPEFRKDFGYAFDGSYVLDAKWQSAFNAAPIASSIIGALASAEIADWIGRKRTLMAALVISYAAISMEFAATTNALFFGGKFMNGFATGTISCIMVTYIGEITPLALRGIFTCMVGVSYGIGPLVAFIVINYTGQFDTRWAYRAVFCTQYGFAAVATLFVWFMPESPWWLAANGRNDKALQSLHSLGHAGESGRKKLALIELTLAEIRQETQGVTYLECFRRSNLRRTIVSIMPECIQVLSGIAFVAGYFTYYLQLAGYSTSMSFSIQIAQPVLSIVGNVMAAAMIDRVGRRDLTFYGLVILVVVLFITGGLATAGSPGAIKGTVALILIYSWLYNVTIGSTAFTILCEVATSRLRAKTIAIGLAVQAAINVMWQFVLPYLFNPDKANLGAKVSFIFGGASFLCLLYLWFYQPETAGRSYEELDEMFAKGVPARKFKSFKTDAQAKGEAVKEHVVHDKVPEES